MSKLRRYNVNEIYANRFYQMPKFLFAGKFKTELSSDAKILYALLKDRHELSIRNKWFDENGDIFLYFTRQEMGELLCCGKNKVIKLCNELKKFGLIEEVRQGLNKPNKIYLNVAEYEFSSFDDADIDNNISNQKTSDDEQQTVEIIDNIVEEDITTVEPTPTKDINEEIKENIDYEFVKTNKPELFDFVDTCYELIKEVMHTKEKSIRIASQNKKIDDIRDRFKKIKLEHIEYIQDSIEESKPNIKNIKKYLLASLYNAPITMQPFIDNQVNKMLN